MVRFSNVYCLSNFSQNFNYSLVRIVSQLNVNISWLFVLYFRNISNYEFSYLSFFNILFVLKIDKNSKTV